MRKHYSYTIDKKLYTILWIFPYNRAFIKYRENSVISHTFKAQFQAFLQQLMKIPVNSSYRCKNK
jgi:hypothetical protein